MRIHRDREKVNDEHPQNLSHDEFFEHLRSLMNADSGESDIDTGDPDRLFDELFEDND